MHLPFLFEYPYSNKTEMPCNFWRGNSGISLIGKMGGNNLFVITPI